MILNLEISLNHSNMVGEVMITGKLGSFDERMRLTILKTNKKPVAE